MTNSQIANIKRQVRAMVVHRSGYRGIASSWDEKGNPIIRIDIDATTKPGQFSDIPKELGGIHIKIRQVKGTVRMQGVH